MWNILQCAVQGRLHIKSNLPCQDKTFGCSNSDISVIALSDGAGSAKYSHFGAECSVKEISQLLSNKFDYFFQENDGSLVKQEIVTYIRERLQSLATEKSCELRDLACTLLAVAIKGENYIIVHIGDGVIGYLKNDLIKVASYPSNGEFANTTDFVTSSSVFQSMKLMKGKIGEIVGFALMSDGTEASFYDKKTKELSTSLKRMMVLSRTKRCDVLENEIYEAFKNVIVKKTSDDCSLALLVKDDNEFQGYSKLKADKKSILLGLKDKILGGISMHRIDMLLGFMQTPKSIDDILSIMYPNTRLRKKNKILKDLSKLIKRGLVVRKGEYFQTAIIINK